MRKLSGITKEKLGELTGIDLRQLTSIENMNKIPNPKELLLISLALGCKIADLFRE